MNEFGLIRVIAQGGANLLNAEVQALLKIDKGISTPKVLLDFFASDQLSAAAGKKNQKLRRLRRQLDRQPPLPQFSSTWIELKGSEIKAARRSGAGAHNSLLPSGTPLVSAILIPFGDPVS